MSFTKHADDRLKERHGSGLTMKDADKVVSDIHDGKALFLCKSKQDKNNVFFAVLLGRKAIPVLYSKKTKNIVTIYHRSKMVKLIEHGLID